MVTRTSAPKKAPDSEVTPALDGLALEAEPASEFEDSLRANENEALSALMAELAGNSAARVTIYRYIKNEPAAYVGQCSPENFSLDELRDKYGGGDFRLFVTHSGKKGVFRNLRVRVERTEKLSAPPISHAGPALGDLVTLMREGQQKQTELLLTALQTQRAPAVDPAGMLTALVTAMATMQKMMAPPAPAIVAPPPDNGLKAADLILKGVELAKELGSNDGGAGPLDLLRDLFRSPFLAELAAQSQRVAVSAPRAAPPGARLTGAAPAPATPAPVPQPPAATDEEIMFKSYVGAMVDRAARGSDPGLYAEYIVDNVPGPIITSWLAREDLIGYLTGMDSRVADHRQWFEDLREEINALLTEAPESVIHAGNVPESTAADADSQDT